MTQVVVTLSPLLEIFTLFSISDVGLISGWGRLSEGGSLPHILQAVEAAITPKEECYNTYLAAGYSKYLNPCHVCTGTKQGGIDTCQVRKRLV